MTLTQFARSVSDLPRLRDGQWLHLTATKALETAKVSRLSKEVKQIIYGVEDALPDLRDFDDLVSAVLSDACI